MTEQAAELDELDEDYDEDAPAEPEVYTHCWECGEPLDESVDKEEDACHEDCDPDKPYTFWIGALAPNGRVDRDQAEGYRKVKEVAEETLDLVLEFEVPRGETYIEFDDGTVVDAREWIERPENLELAGGRDQYVGRGEFNPDEPHLAWFGQTLPSGKMARPNARRFETLTELAVEATKARGGRRPIQPGEWTVMLPGGEFVDADEWARRPETRRLVLAAKPENFWMGALADDGTVDFDQAKGFREASELADAAAEVIVEFEAPYGKTYIEFSDGTVVDAREWIERPENRELARRGDQYAGRGEYDPQEPHVAWFGQTLPSGRMARPTAQRFESLTELAEEVVRVAFRGGHPIQPGERLVMLPGGEYRDAYDWAQLPETRRLAGSTLVQNYVRFRAQGACQTCGAVYTADRNELVFGEIGQEVRGAAALYCEACDNYLMPVFVPVTLVDDASAVQGTAPRLIGDAEPEPPAVEDAAAGSMSGSLDELSPSGDAGDRAGGGTISGSLDVTSSATIPLPAGGGALYQRGVAQLLGAAAEVGREGEAMRSFADGLSGNRWGAAVVASVGDASGLLREVEGQYRGLAGQMDQEGQNGAAAHDSVPYAPDPEAMH